ncbi:MAG: hypothetical protein KC503_23885 [Myxococcales bacterium]|nr:hypothetical protein [Myxococcales bacterium]
MRSRRRISILTAILAASTLASTAHAGDFAGKKAYTSQELSRTQRIRQVQQSHPWALTTGGANWFNDKAKVKLVQQAFAEHSARFLKGAVRDGLVADCADLALINLHTFAKNQGLRVPFKVYVRVTEDGRSRWRARWIDSADFRSPEEFIRFLRQKTGALHVIDNMSPALLVKNVRSPQDLLKLSPGDARMKVHIPRDGSGVKYGHTEPISGIKIGSTLQDSKIEIVYGNVDIASATDYPVANKTENVHTAIQPGSLIADHSFLGGVTTAVAPVDYRKIRSGDKSPQNSQALGMRWQILKTGINAE